MYSLVKISIALLITSPAWTTAVNVHTRRTTDGVVSPNASSLDKEPFSLTHEVLLAWTAKNTTPSQSKAPSIHAGPTNGTAPTVAPVSEKKRYLRARAVAELVPEAEKVTVAPALEIPATGNLTENQVSHADEIDASTVVQAVANGTGSIVVVASNSTGDNRTKNAAESPSFADPFPGRSNQEFLVVCFAVASLIMASCCFFAWYVGDEKDEKEAMLPPLSPQAAQKTHANLLTAIKCADGTWAQNYERADQPRKAALELIFRCNIVRVQEFAHSRVNQDHIDECVWIATHMLKKKSLEEWVEHWEEARKAFENDVTACFKARTATKDAQANPTSPESGSSSPFRMGEFARQNSADERNLLGRCREIMALSRQLHTPRESRSGFRTVEQPDNTTPRSRPVTPRGERPNSSRSLTTSQTDLHADVKSEKTSNRGSPRHLYI